MRGFLTGADSFSDEHTHAPGVQLAVRAAMALLVVGYALLAHSPAASDTVFFQLATPAVRIGLAAGYLAGHLLYFRIAQRSNRPRLIIVLASLLDTGGALVMWLMDPLEPGPMMLLLLVAVVGNGIQHGKRQFRVELMVAAVGAPLLFAVRVWLFDFHEASLGLVVVGASLAAYTYFLVARLEAARQENSLLAWAIETTNTGVTIKDCAGRVLYVNPADLRMHGYQRPSQVIGLAASVFGTGDARRPMTGDDLRSVDAWTREAVNVRKDGSAFLAQLTSDVIRDDIGNPMAIVTLCEDITDRKAMEEELRQADLELKRTTGELIQAVKLTELGELAASVAHELNQPLNSVKLSAQEILRYLDTYDREELARDLREIVQSVNAAADVVSHVQRFARRTEGITIEKANVNAILERALSLTVEQLKAHGIELVTSLDTDLPAIDAEPTRLEQAFLNLITNARHALEACAVMPKRLELRTYRTRIGIGDHRGVDSIVIEVLDNGIGIADDVRPRIFEPFFTTKEPGHGTGLGLAIVQRIVKEHQGDVEVEPRPSGGTAFRIILPIDVPPTD